MVSPAKDRTPTSPSKMIVSSRHSRPKSSMRLGSSTTAAHPDKKQKLQEENWLFQIEHMQRWSESQISALQLLSSYPHHFNLLIEKYWKDKWDKSCHRSEYHTWPTKFRTAGAEIGKLRLATCCLCQAKLSGPGCLILVDIWVANGGHMSKVDESVRKVWGISLALQQFDLAKENRPFVDVSWDVPWYLKHQRITFTNQIIVGCIPILSPC
jgi:hypothetical protein